MKRQRFLAVVLALSGSLFLMAGEQAAQADPPIKDLSGVTQNWDKKLTGATRFTVLSDFGGAAVRDNETGLVWEQSPEATNRTWNVARAICADKNVGGRKGWRLPSVAELSSLVDPGQINPSFPPVHPFTNVQLDRAYWSATMDADIPSNAWTLTINIGFVGSGTKSVSEFHLWCVRGPMQESVY
jgi:hypothetical protein